MFTIRQISLLLTRFVFRMAEASAKRLTGDEPQGTMGRLQTSRLPLRKRDVWVRGRRQIVFAPARKPYRIALLFTQENSDFGAISVTEQSFAAPIA